MCPAVITVAIGHTHYTGMGTDYCYLCGVFLCKGFPSNYPQVCQPCADREVWQYRRDGQRPCGCWEAKKAKAA